MLLTTLKIAYTWYECIQKICAVLLGIIFGIVLFIIGIVGDQKKGQTLQSSQLTMGSVLIVILVYTHNRKATWSWNPNIFHHVSHRPHYLGMVIHKPNRIYV